MRIVDCGLRTEDWGVAAGGEDGGEVGLGDVGGECFGCVAFVLEGLGKGADAEAGFKRVAKGGRRKDGG